MNRRRLLAGLVSGSLIGLGGCSSGTSRQDSPIPTDESTPTESPSVDLSGCGPFDGWSMARGGPRRLGRNGSGPAGRPEEAWTTSLSHARHRLAVVDGVAFVTQEGVATTALDPTDGTRLAEDVTGEDRPETEPVAVDGRLYYGTFHGELVSREAESAAELWRIELPRVPDDHGGEMPIELRSTPAIAAERAYVRGASPEDSTETATFCLRAAASAGGTACDGGTANDGWPRTHGVDALADPVTDGELLVVQSRERLLALNVGAHGPQGNTSRPEDVDRDDARFYALDRAAGESVASFDGDGLLSDPVVGSGGAYVSFGNEVTGFR